MDSGQSLYSAKSPTALLTIIILCSPCIGKAAESELQLVPLGQPTAEKVEVARKINELKLHNNRLYLGHGDYSANTGPTDVIYYDLASKEFVSDFTVDEEAIMRYRVINDRLVIPGVDATESHDFANVYVNGNDGWTKHRTVAQGLHVFDVVSYRNRWYAATGSEMGPTKNDSFAVGMVMSSGNRGASWRSEYVAPSDVRLVYRINHLAAFQDRLFGFGYAFGQVPKAAIPEADRSSLGKPRIVNDWELYDIEYDDPFGESETIVFDGFTWKQRDLIPDAHITRIRPIVFGNHLLLVVSVGRYRTESQRLYSFDGEKVEPVGIEFERVLDMIASHGRLLLLIQKHDRQWIAWSENSETWQQLLLPTDIRPISLEYDGESYYLGCRDGSLFRIATNDAKTDQ
jgi:hypothetical protein